MRAGSQGTRVGDAHGSRRAAELRLQHRAVFQVHLPRFVRVVERDGEMPAALAIEDRAEQRVRVEAWDAQPRDRAVARDQRGSRAIADETVILDREVTLA